MNRFTPLLLGLGLLLAAPLAAQTTHEVTVSNFQFSPANLTIEAGDTVRWTNVAGFHNVNGTTATFPDNPEGFGNVAASAPWTYEFTFDLEGDYDYLCDIHPSSMQGSITVNAGGSGVSVSASGTPSSIPPGGTLTVNVAVTNSTGSAITVDGWIVAERGGNPVLTRLIGSGTIPDGVTVTRSFALGSPDNTPPGVYDITFNVGDFSTLTVLGSDTFPVTVTAERLPGAPEAEGASEVFVIAGVAGDLFASAASPAEGIVAYPNPARGTTTLRFALTAPAAVRLSVYDALGREVAVLVDGPVEAGAHAAVLDGSALPAGAYVYRLVTNGQEQTGHLTLVR